MKVTLDIGKCQDVVKTWEEGSIDAVITDPPYGFLASPITRICSWCALPDVGFIESTEGLGTALKPAWEPIVVARKPLEPVTMDLQALLETYGFSPDQIDYIMGGE